MPSFSDDTQSRSKHGLRNGYSVNLAVSRKYIELGILELDKFETLQLLFEHDFI